MTNNFDIIIDNLLVFPKKNNYNNYYAVELIRRGKDNPDMPAANYHFKNYYIYSVDSLNSYKDEIITLCDTLNMRAYISVNKKNVEQVTKNTATEYCRRIAVGDFKCPYKIYESESGKYVMQGDKKFIVDVDNCNIDSPKVSEYSYIINQCRNDKRKTDTGFDNVICIIPTRSGVHIITYGFDRKSFNERCIEKNLEVPDIKENHLTLLYENLG